MSGLAIRAPLGRGPATQAQGPRRSLTALRMPTWVLAALFAVVALTTATFTRELSALEADPAVPWGLVALLFAIAESVVFHVRVRGNGIAIVLRGTPLLLGLFFLPPLHLLVAYVVGATLALAVRRPASAAEGALRVAATACGLAAAVIMFRVIADGDMDSPLDWLASASAAALIVATASTVSRPPVPSSPGTRGKPAARVAALVSILALAVADASFGMAVVLHAQDDPAELWLLAGPVLIAVLAYRAYASLRRRQAGFEFIDDCTRILDGPATGEAMVVELLERTRRMFMAESAELIVEGGGEAPIRTAVGLNGAGEGLTAATAGSLPPRIGMIPCGKNGVLIYPGHHEEAPVSSVHLDVVDGALAHFHGHGGLRGTVLVAGRTDGRRYDGQDLRLLETLAGDVGRAMGGLQVMDELVTSLADASRLADLVGTSKDAIVVLTPERVVTGWNPAAEALFGYPASEVVGGFATHIAPPERLQDLRVSFARACRGAQVRNLEFDARRRDGTVVPVSAALSPIRNAAGEITGVSLIARDETERTLQESALRRSRDRFRGVFDGSSVGIGVIGGDYRWLRVNEALRRTVATTDSSLVGQRFEQLVDRDDVGSAHEVVARLLRGEGTGSTIEIRFRAPGAGRAVVTRFTVRPLRDGDGTMQVLCLIEDVTAHRLAEQQARETEARLHRAVLDLTAVREPAEVVQATLRAVRDVIDAESAAVVVLDAEGEGPADLVLDDEADAGELGRLLREDLPAAIAGAAGGPMRLPQVDDGEGGGMTALPSPAGLRSYLAVPVLFEGRLLATVHVGNRRRADGFSDADVEVATVLAAQAAISLENARIHQVALTLVRDLDEANASLQQASVIRSRILASVSHELRTPLHSILVAAQLVRDSGVEQGGSRRVRGLGATIEGSGRHLLGLVDDFLDLSTIEAGAFELRPTVIRLAPLLREVRRDIAPLAAEKGISLNFAQVPGVVVVADPLRLRQVLLNLLSNAVKFTGRGGRVRVSVRSEADSLRISVRDTGIGIAPGDLERAFLPFEQVSATDVPGAGLGLAISRRITELHGGTLTARSAIGRGSTFTIALPLAAPDIASEAASG